MKSLKLKPLQLNDNFPLIISLIGNVERGVAEEIHQEMLELQRKLKEGSL